jgi:phosphoribosylamine--glycine ligase
MAEVLVLDGGGRGHAIADVIAQSPEADKVHVGPGNAGTEDPDRGMFNVGFGWNDTEKIIDFAEDRPDLTVVIGPEAPLVAGLANRLRQERIAVFGPNQGAARLEGSKIYAANFMNKYGIPQPDFIVARTVDRALNHLRGLDPQKIVLKADGLAGGKGVVLPETREEMEAVVIAMLSGEGYSRAGENGILISQRHSGPELSVFVVSDGSGVSIIPYFAQDHKRLKDGDEGPNTGGMGAYTPLPEDMLDGGQIRSIENIALRTIEGIRREGDPYNGVLYLGLMLAEQRGNSPEVIEFNVRLGDPEAQVVLPSMARADMDVFGMFHNTARGRRLDEILLPRNAGGAALTVCLVAEGYPDSPQPGAIIQGLDQSYDGVTVYHGSTRRREDGQVEVDGGRVLYVTGVGENVDEAAAKAYAAIGRNAIHIPDGQYRNDIGHQARKEWR